MEKTFTIHCVLIDTEHDDEKSHLFVEVDTIKNHASLYELKGDVADEDIEKRFHKRPGYHLEVRSDLLVSLTDRLGGIIVDGKRIDGKEALKLFRDGRLDEIIEGVTKELDGKNLLKTVPSLLSVLSENYTTDMPLIEIVKTVLGEVNDFKDWKADLYRS